MCIFDTLPGDIDVARLWATGGRVNYTGYGQQHGLHVIESILSLRPGGLICFLLDG